jgi:catechol 2,3-dioxygenase
MKQERAMSNLPKAALTHLGILVWDLDKMIAFYEREFGMVVADRGTSTAGLNAAFLTGNANEHHELVLVAAREPGQKSTLNQISFEVETLEDVRRYWKHFSQNDTQILQTKNHGNAWSIYIADPEGNRLEIYAHAPWYMEQPVGAPIDYSKSVEELMIETEALARSDPGFMMRGEWMAKVQSELGALGRG